MATPTSTYLTFPASTPIFPRYSRNAVDPRDPDIKKHRKEMEKHFQRDDAHARQSGGHSPTLDYSSPTTERGMYGPLIPLDPKSIQKRPYMMEKSGDWSRTQPPACRSEIKIPIPSAPSSPVKHQSFNVFKQDSVESPISSASNPRPPPPVSPPKLDPRWALRKIPTFIPHPHSNKHSKMSQHWHEFHRPSHRDRQKKGGTGKSPPRGPRADYDHRVPRSRALAPTQPPVKRGVSAPASNSSKSSSLELRALSVAETSPAGDIVMPTIREDTEVAESWRTRTVMPSTPKPAHRHFQVNNIASPPLGPSPPPPPPSSSPPSQLNILSPILGFQPLHTVMEPAAASVAPATVSEVDVNPEAAQPSEMERSEKPTVTSPQALPISDHSAQSHSLNEANMDIDSDLHVIIVHEGPLSLDISASGCQSTSIKEKEDERLERSIISEQPLNIDKPVVPAKSSFGEPNMLGFKSISFDDLDALQRNASAVTLNVARSASVTSVSPNPALSVSSVAQCGNDSVSRTGTALVTPESRLTSLSPACQAEPPAAARESTPPPKMTFWIQEGLPDIDRWNIEDRLKTLHNVVLSESVEVADFVLLNVPPGRTASDPSLLSVFSRPIIPVSCHWALASARQGKPLDIVPFLVFPVLTPVVKPSAAPPIQVEAVPKSEHVNPSRARELSDSEEEDMPVHKRKKTRHWSIESISPDRDEIKASRFVQEYNKYRSKHRKWVEISKAILEYPAEPTAWRAYMEDNLQELLAQGLRLADPRRKSSPRKRSDHRTSQRQVSEAISSTAESDADSQDSLTEDEKSAGSEGISKSNSNHRCRIRKSHRAAPAEHLELLRQSLDKVQPQKKEDFMLAYNLAAKKTQKSSFPRTALGFKQLHFRNKVPGWEDFLKQDRNARPAKKAGEVKESASETENSDSSESGSEDESSPEEEFGQILTSKQVETDLKSSITAVGSPYGDYSDDEKQVSTGPKPSSQQSAQNVASSKHKDMAQQDGRMQTLLAHLSNYDPTTHGKVAFIKSLETETSTSGRVWYRTYLDNKSYYDERIPALSIFKKGPRPRLSGEFVRSRASPEVSLQSEGETTVVLQSIASQKGSHDVTMHDADVASVVAGLERSSHSQEMSPLSPMSSVDPVMIAREAALKQFAIKRWLTPVEEDNLERFVATRSLEVDWLDIFVQWSQLCSATPFTPQHIQVFIQVIDFDVFEEKIEERRAAATAKGRPVSWTPPGPCSTCNLNSPDLVDRVCVDCRAANTSNRRH